MKLLDRSKLEDAYISFSVIFDMALANTRVIYPEIATVLSDVGPFTEFKWLDDMPVMQTWLGDRAMQRLRAESVRLTTGWYANGIEIDVDDIKEDRLGLVRPRIEQLAQMGPRKIDAIVLDMLNKGFAGTIGLTYDGQYLFDTDHTAAGNADPGAPIFSNRVAGALSSATFNTAIGQQQGFQGTNNEPLELTPDMLVAGPTNQLVLRQLLLAQYNAAGASNVDYGYVRGIVNARITGAYAAQAYLLATKHAVRAAIVGIEYPPEFAELNGWEQPAMFHRRTIEAGAHMKLGAIYGLWQTAVGIVGS